jgi:trimeric autotransporter adhesin
MLSVSFMLHVWLACPVLLLSRSRNTAQSSYFANYVATSPEAAITLMRALEANVGLVRSQHKAAKTAALAAPIASSAASRAAVEATTAGAQSSALPPLHRGVERSTQQQPADLGSMSPRATRQRSGSGSNQSAVSSSTAHLLSGLEGSAAARGTRPTSRSRSRPVIPPASSSHASSSSSADAPPSALGFGASVSMPLQQQRRTSAPHAGLDDSSCSGGDTGGGGSGDGSGTPGAGTASDATPFAAKDGPTEGDSAVQSGRRRRVSSVATVDSNDSDDESTPSNPSTALGSGHSARSMWEELQVRYITEQEE